VWTRYSLFLDLIFVAHHIQALLGFEHELKHLDGHVVSLRRQGVTQPGSFNLCVLVPDIDHSFRIRTGYY
jgi:hypothetical protein